MAKIITANTLFSKQVTRDDRILLLNPPVEETRYSWVRWNQPLDLLKIASLWLRSQVECRVELLDCMKPDDGGKVPEDWLPRDRRYYEVKGDKYPMRRFGTSYANIKRHLAAMRLAGEKREPTQVWITSLCSYWYESVAEVCRIIRQALPDTRIVLLGQYTRLMPKHAAEASADFVVSRPPDLSLEPSAFDLYGLRRPPFVALQLNPPVAVAEVLEAVEHGVLQFTFFEEDVCQDEGEPLLEIFTKTKSLHRHLRYHFICGLDPAKVTPAIARVLADKQVAVAHFEEAAAGTELDLQAYKKARAYMCEAGMKDTENRLSGFVWLGRPGDQLAEIILRSFDVLNQMEGLILKPYTPTPGSPEHLSNEAYLASIPHREWSPHFFPFAELNGITRGEYHDLYRMAAFLNEKIRAGSFDFLKGTLGAQMLRESLRREVWKLEPSPLRLVD